jgi:NADH:ubiquinone oxidoreductase subunit D
MARCTGLKRDIRMDSFETYANYYYLNFRGYVGQHGDSYDRFLLRMNEMTESLNIINQVINKLQTKQKKPIKTNSHFLLKYLNTENFNNKHYKSEYASMEGIIKHFKY